MAKRFVVDTLVMCVVLSCLVTLAHVYYHCFCHNLTHFCQCLLNICCYDLIN